MTIINMNPKRGNAQPLFFGEPLGIQRYDQVSYPKLVSLRKRMIAYNWDPEEIDTRPDQIDYLRFDTASAHVFTSNLQFQIYLDSLQGRGPLAALGPFISSPELESTVLVWQFFENIHSLSYTNIVTNVYPDPTIVFDDILKNRAIIRRAKSVCEVYNKFGASSLKPTKKDIYLLLASINILEGIRFYISFACSFAFDTQGQMTKSASILKLIARDENLHLQISQFLLNQLPLEDSEWAQVAKDCREEVIEMYKTAVKEEIDWAHYLFQYGSIIGLNVPIIADCLHYWGNFRLGAIGLPHAFPEVKSHPMPWINDYLNTRNTQLPPQEKELTGYLKGGGMDPSQGSVEGLSL